MSVNSIFLSDCEVIDQINLLQTQKPLGWQEQAVKILKQSWNYDLEMDLQRVQKYNLVSQQLLEKVKFAVSRERVPYWIEYFEGKSFKEIYQICFSMFWNLFILSKISRQEVRRFTSELNVTVSYVARFIWNSLTFLNQEKKTSSVDIQSVAMIARALEIKEIYKQSFHVFLHAQNSGLLVIPDLIKEFIKAIDPQNCPHQFKFLRIPKEEPLWDITEYSEAENVDDGVNPARDDLLSVDGYFLHKENWESSIFFMKKNTNIMHSNLFLLESVISHFCPDLEMEKIQQFALRVSDITAQDNSKIGNLFLLCIPKEISPKVQYRAHPFGNPCDCHSKEEDLDILEVLQNDQLSSEAICYGMDLPRNYNFQDESYYFEIPQYRLFTPELKPENGVKIYFIPSNKEYRDMVKMQIKTIVQEILSLKSVI